MSIRAKLLASAASVGVLFLGWQAGTANGLTTAPTTDTTAKNTTTATTAGSPSTSTSKSTTTTTTAGTSTSSAASTKPATTTTTAASTAPASTTTTAASGSGASGTYTGATATHRFGTITVTVTVANGQITGITYTSSGDGKNSRYESMAIPQLKSAVLKAQSTDVSTISGATLTSVAYLTSLQSALDKAGI